MPVAVGWHVQLLVYELEGDVAIGYSVNIKEELRVKIDPNDGVYHGYSISFDVARTIRDLIIPAANSVRAFFEDDRVKVSGNRVELATMVILSSKSTKDYELWSPEFGYVLMVDDFHATRDVIYSTYVIRDRSQRAQHEGYLFSISGNLKQVEQGKKDNLLSQLREEEERRPARESTGPVYGTTGFNVSHDKWGHDQGFNNNDREKQFKQIANEVSSFLIVNTIKRGSKVYGEAWAVPIRDIAVTCDSLSGTTTPLQVGFWYDGVVKYSKKQHPKHRGFFVEKVWRLSESPPLHTKVKNNQIIEVGVELDFFDSSISNNHARNNYPACVVLEHPLVMSALVPEKMFYNDEYYGNRCHCVLQYISEGACNWKVVNVKRKIAPSAYIHPGDDPHNSDFQELNNTEHEDLARPPDDDDDDVDDEEDGDDGLPSFQSKPNPGVQRPVPHRPTEYGNQQQGNTHSSVFSNPSFSNRSNPNVQQGSDSGYVGQSSFSSTQMNYSNNVDYDSPEVQDQGIVTEAAQRSYILYSNRTQACYVRNVTLYPGDWIYFSARKLKRKEGGCWYEARPDSIRKVVDSAVNPVFKGNGFIWMDSTVDMQYKFKTEKAFLKIYSTDVGWVFANYEIEMEQNGMVNLDQMVNHGGHWRVWIRYFYSQGTDEYYWEVVQVRGPRDEVVARDKESDMRNLRNVVDEDEVEMEKQKAMARAEMERMNLNNQQAGSSQGPGMGTEPRPSASPAGSMMSTMSTLANNDLIALWQINDVRKAVKTTDYNLYERIEESVSEARMRTPCPPSRNECPYPNRTRVDRPSSSASQQSFRSDQRNTGTSSLRDAFGTNQPSHMGGQSGRYQQPQQQQQHHYQQQQQRGNNQGGYNAQRQQDGRFY